MKQICRILLLVCTTFLLLFAQKSKRALTFDDMMACKQIGSPTISINGKTIAFTIKTVNEKDNSSHKEIYTIKSDAPIKDKEKFLMQYITTGKYNLKPKYVSLTKRAVNNALKILGMQFNDEEEF